MKNLAYQQKAVSELVDKTIQAIELRRTPSETGV